MAITLATRYRPHIAVVDLFIGEESGAEICEQLRAAEPSTRVLLFSGAGAISPNAARAAGASGFAYKDWPAAKIARAVQLVGGGALVAEGGQRPQDLFDDQGRLLRGAGAFDVEEAGVVQ